MLGTLREALQSEMEQVTKIVQPAASGTGPSTAGSDAAAGHPSSSSHGGGPSSSSSSSSSTDAGPSALRESLLQAEHERARYVREAEKLQRDSALKITALELEVSTLESENDRLRWEPRKARDGFVLLLVCLSVIFSLMVFALFAMAERQLGRERNWEDQLQGHVLGVLGSVLLVGAVPLTHLSGQYLYGDVGFRFYQPMEGGSTYVFLQVFGWGFYGAFLAVALFVVSQGLAHGLVTLAGVLGVLGQVVMVCSLLSFRPSEAVVRARGGSDASFGGGDEDVDKAAPLARKQGKRKRKVSVPPRTGVDAADNGEEWDLWLDADLQWNSGAVPRMDTDTALFAAFMTLQSSLVVISLALGFIAERAAADQLHVFITGSLSLLLLVIAALLTHGLGGSLSHRASWKAFRPFAGGTQFLLLQGIVWGVLGLCVACQASFLGIPIYLSSRLVSVSGDGMPMTSAGLVAVAGHALLVLSIGYYREHERQVDAAARQKDALAETAALTADLDPAVLRAASEFRFEQVTDPSLMAELARRMAAYAGPVSYAGTFVIVCLCNTHWLIFIIASFMFYAPFAGACALLGEASDWCIPQPDDTLSSLGMFSICICAFTVGYSIIKTFNVRGTARIVALIMLNALPVSLTLQMHRDSPIQPLLRVYAFLFVVYNYRTYSGMPEVTGCREWPAFRTWRAFWKIYEDYNGTRLIADAELAAFEKADGGHSLGSAQSSCKQAICGYAPHGIFPTTVIWFPNSSLWRDRFPGWTVNSFTASIISLVPIMRDFAQWAGVRDVGRESVDHGLRKGVSPLLVVGGQSEMFLSKSWLDTIDVHRRHKGFVRMAIRHGVPIVPIFSFGEHKCMDNLYYPRVQAWFKARFGFPVPYLPYGRWFMPVTRRVPLTLCVGKPIFPVKQNDKPTKEEMDELHHRYFEYLGEMFERNKQAAGFPNAKINWAWD